MLDLVGYADRLSARPGETINFRLSNATGKPVEAQFVRVICADPNPAGPGIREEPLAITLPSMEVDAHPVQQGSYAVAELGGAIQGLADFTLVLTIQPTRLPQAGEAAVLTLASAAANASSAGDVAGQSSRSGHAGEWLGVSIDADGCLNVRLAGASLRTAPVALREWVDIAISYDQKTGALICQTRPVVRGAEWTSVSASGAAPAVAPAEVSLHIAGPVAGSGHTYFDGRIENPELYARVLTDADRDMSRQAVDRPSEQLFAFDFAAEISSSRIVDTGPHGFIGRLINHPTRAMRSSRWNGHEMCFRHCPEQYAAIHFHSDDITDCRWPTALAWQVPSGLPSGCYALRIRAGDEADNIPFFVVPPKGRPAARIAALVSTFTYTIYANHARPEFRLSSRWAKAWRQQAAEWQAYPHNPADHPEYGWSTYNDHTDGSGISISSCARPILNLRIGYITYPYPDIRASGLRHYPADTHLHTWLEDQGIAFDIITDQELHDEGYELLRDYTVVLTGSHPEYHTRDMLDALETYRDRGGRLMYLGGNGFYWKIALEPEVGGIVEIRRGEGGIRAWAAEPGEYYNQFDGEYGGLWRRNGRPPQDLCGVGFSAQGNFVGSHYSVDEAARASRAGWMLEGITGPVFGGHGLSGHGAAGFELDRADKNLGTPRHAVILATSDGHEPEAPWVLVPEERLTHITTISGESEPELIRSDIVFFETPNNGAVFSVGSITYCGSLLTNGGDNDIARLTRNVLNRFADPDQEFIVPGR